jgi:hypothetical protein
VGNCATAQPFALVPSLATVTRTTAACHLRLAIVVRSLPTLPRGRALLASSINVLTAAQMPGPCL